LWQCKRKGLRAIDIRYEAIAQSEIVILPVIPRQYDDRVTW
jgi:hypothetical protein